MMNSRRYLTLLLAASLLCLLSLHARGQSMARVAQDSWNGTDFVTTYDNPVLELGGHVSNSGNADRVQVWDSYGRIRFNKNDDNSPFLAYRNLSGDINTHDQRIHATTDDLELAAGVHWGTLDGWKIASVLGVGYSSSRPFVNEKGLFGIGDITAAHPLDSKNSILFAIDYGGNNSLLPDIPLPGFAWTHYEPKLDVVVGFPVSRVIWTPVPKLIVDAKYIVPYTASINVEYLPVIEHFGVYASASNYFQGIVISKEDSIDRQFLQMRRVEMGLRIVFTPLVDAGVGLGYAFDQTISQGYDIRSLRGIAHLSNEPYLSIVLHGRF